MIFRMKKFLTTILLPLLLASSIVAQDIDRPKIGLVLSGGGAHGLAHIGVLRYLEDKDIPIDYITGTSMGAVIGGLYAMGYDSHKIEGIARAVDWDDVLSNHLKLNEVAPSEKDVHNRFALNFIVKDGEIKLPQGFINTQKLDLLISRLYSTADDIEDFDDLKIPFRCMAVDLESGDIKTFDRGNLSQAIRASMAIPSVFPPTIVDGQFYVDGGLIRNLPAQENLDLGADILIGVYVGGRLEIRDDLKSLFDVLSQSAFMMSILDSEEQKKLVDVLIEPDTHDESTFAFKEVDLFFHKGYQEASVHEDAIEKIKRQAPQGREEMSTPNPPEALRLSKIQFPRTPEPFDDFARFKFGKVRPSTLRYSEIESSINKVYGSKHFENVSYIVDTDEAGKRTMSIIAEPKNHNDLYANLNYFPSVGAGLILHADIRNKISQPSVLSATVRISERVAASVDYDYRLGDKKDFILMFDSDIHRQAFFLFEEDVRIKDYIYTGSDINIGLAREPNNKFWYGLNAGIRRDRLDLTRFSDGLQNYKRNNGELRGFFEYNTLNQPYYSTEGFLFDLSVRHQLELNSGFEFSLGPREFIPEEQNYTLASARIKAVVSPTNFLTASLSGIAGWKSAVSFLDNFRVGGIEEREPLSVSFIGLTTDQFHFSELIKGRLDLRTRVLSNIYLDLIVDYVNGQRAFQFTESRAEDLQLSFWGYGVKFSYDSPLGPISFAHGRNTLTDTWESNFTIGYTFF
jgi:NTE family protein